MTGKNLFPVQPASGGIGILTWFIRTLLKVKCWLYILHRHNVHTTRQPMVDLPLRQQQARIRGKEIIPSI